MHDPIDVFKTRTQANADIKPATVTAHLGAVKRILKTWPGIDALEPRQITPPLVFDWAARFRILCFAVARPGKLPDNMPMATLTAKTRRGALPPAS